MLAMRVKRIENRHGCSPQLAGCWLLILASVVSAALFAWWASFIYQPSTSMAQSPGQSTPPPETVAPSSPVGVEIVVSPTPELTQTPTPAPDTETPTPAPSPTAQPPIETEAPTATSTPTLAATPAPLPASALPTKVLLSPMIHEYQKLNNCGPVSLAMAADYYGASITQFDAADVVKGSPQDRNVSPEEMVDYLHSLGLGAEFRVDGSQDLMQRLLAAGLPVIVHQWLVRPQDGVLVGHYRVLRGYDAGRSLFIANDPYTGPNFTISYTQFEEWWRPFNRGYIPVYRPEQEAQVAAILGDDWDAPSNWRHALAGAQTEVQSIADGYAFFNLGDDYLALDDPVQAVQAYNRALAFELPDHFLWYQFGPLEAFNRTGDHQRVLDITKDVLAKAGELEEARLQRGMAYLALGNPAAARTEAEKALADNPRYKRAEVFLESIPN
jgi:tetratricopeptide (TPR) repeat protein